jgi:SAM-dependent methyltransferase
MDYRERIYGQYTARFQSSGYRRPDLAKHWARAYRWFFRGWLPPDPEVAILDAGCGGGQMLEALRLLGYGRSEGVDTSESQVEKARAAGLNVSCGNALDFLRGKQRCWDIILAIDLLEHLRKDEVMEFLPLVREALRPGGRLIVQMPNPDALAGMRVRYGDLTHEIALGPDCALRLLELFDFEPGEARETGPVPGWAAPVATLRWVLWQLMRGGFRIFDAIETGGCHAKIFTRVYLVSAKRPAETR